METAENLEIVELQKDLGRFALSQDVDLFGVADLAKYGNALMGHGNNFLGRFKRGLSVGLHLSDAVVDGLEYPDDRGLALTYRFHVYEVVNLLLDKIALGLAARLQNAGYVAYPVPASQTIDQERFMGIISHKLVANLAGLGWIGKNCLLVTPEFGPRVRFATVLTDAPLRPAVLQLGSRCGSCTLCVETCPAGAFTGAAFAPDEPREARFAPGACSEYCRRRKEEWGIELRGSFCGRCVYICPWGRKS
ncbi:MAG: 4Fe-4S dicluster domain-containing protein [Firmicutes bacterium]|nr:4Fe-4S dicluster domain-containing protein [Bacillota bacterium]